MMMAHVLSCVEGDEMDERYLRGILRLLFSCCQGQSRAKFDCQQQEMPANLTPRTFAVQSFNN